MILVVQALRGPADANSIRRRTGALSLSTRDRSAICRLSRRLALRSRRARKSSAASVSEDSVQTLAQPRELGRCASPLAGEKEVTERLPRRVLASIDRGLALL